MKNYHDVLTYLAGYYGDQYNQIKAKAVIDFIQKYPLQTVKIMIGIILRTFSDRWGKAPGVAEFEASLQEFPEGTDRRTIAQIQRDEERASRCKIQLPEPKDMPTMQIEITAEEVEFYQNLINRAKAGEFKKSPEAQFITEIGGAGGSKNA